MKNIISKTLVLVAFSVLVALCQGRLKKVAYYPE